MKTQLLLRHALSDLSIKRGEEREEGSFQVYVPASPSEVALKDDLYEERLHSIFKLILLVSISFHYSNELAARKAKTLLRFYGSAEI